MSKWYYTEAYRAYAPLDAEVKDVPADFDFSYGLVAEDMLGRHLVVCTVGELIAKRGLMATWRALLRSGRRNNFKPRDQ
jgi:hypothetical protein